MIPQGEQADFELRHWDGSDEDDATEGKWLELLDLYGEIDGEVKWEYLRGPGINLVRGDGEDTCDSARIMVVGEGPGAIDNGNRKPFSGTDGELLDQCLELAGLRRDQCFVTNVLKYRSRDGRAPGLGEALMAQDSLRAEWKIINPILTIAIGAVAHRLLNPNPCALTNFPHGEIWTFTGRSDLYVTSMLPPSFGLRYPAHRKAIEWSWETLGQMIDALELRGSL
jgi:uracil-DNA glycosylase family 4